MASTDTQGHPGALVAILIGVMIIDAAAAVGLWHEIQYRDNLVGKVGHPAWVDFDFDVGRSAFMFLATGSKAVFAIFWVGWLYRIADAMQSSATLRCSPARMVYSWLVPLYNCIVPYLGVLSIWRARIGAQAEHTIRAPLAFPLWWTSWIVVEATGVYTWFDYFWAQHSAYDQLRMALMVNLFGHIAAVGAACLLIMIVRRISQAHSTSPM